MLTVFSLYILDLYG